MQPLPFSGSFFPARVRSLGYPMIQGNVGQDYEIFHTKLENSFGNPKPSLFNRPSSFGESSDEQTKEKFWKPKIDKVPQKLVLPGPFYRQNSSSRSGDSSDEETKEKVWKPKIDKVPQKPEPPSPPPSPLNSSSSSGDSSDEETKEKVWKPKIDEVPQKLAPRRVADIVTLGPWGDAGGTAFDDGTYTGIRQINLLSRNARIEWIRVCYDDGGKAVWGSKHGGRGEFKPVEIIFDYPSEILTHIAGTYGPLRYMGLNVIKSLTFYTNKGKHGPFGEEEGASFTSPKTEGIVGFHGREGFFLYAIGVHAINIIQRKRK